MIDGVPLWIEEILERILSLIFCNFKPSAYIGEVVFKVLNRLFKSIVLYLTIPLIYSMKNMFTTNQYIYKMFHSRISKRSCQKCKATINSVKFHCRKCDEWYCLTCGIDLSKCPMCGSKLE